METGCGKTSDNIEEDSRLPQLGDEGEPPVKRGRGRPKGSKNKPITGEIKDLPPRSCRRSSVPDEVIIPAPPARCLKFLSTDWTLTERQELLSGLRVHNYSNHKALSKFVGTKSAQEVQWFLQNLKSRERVLLKDSDLPTKNTAPIELWLNTCEDIVRYETDHSLILGSVMAVAGELEPHHPPYNPKTQPDYTKIYDYLARLLHKAPPPELSPIDSAVVLDLLQNTVDVLRHTDLSCEREMMKEKYVHLNSKNDPTLAECRSALMSTERNEPNVDEVRQQINPLRNDGDTAAENAPSTSRQDSHSSNEAVTGQISSTDRSGDRLDPLLENIDQSRPEFIRPIRQRSGQRKKADTTDTPPGAETQSQESNPGPSSVGGTQFRKRSDGPKAGKLVSINPFCIEVKYLKLSNVQKEDPR